MMHAKVARNNYSGKGPIPGTTGTGNTNYSSAGATGHLSTQATIGSTALTAAGHHNQMLTSTTTQLAGFGMSRDIASSNLGPQGPGRGTQIKDTTRSANLTRANQSMIANASVNAPKFSNFFPSRITTATQTGASIISSGKDQNQMSQGNVTVSSDVQMTMPSIVTGSGNCNSQNNSQTYQNQSLVGQTRMKQSKSRVTDRSLTPPNTAAASIENATNRLPGQLGTGKSGD